MSDVRKFNLLPPELWLEIIRLGTSVSTPLYPTYSSPEPSLTLFDKSIWTSPVIEHERSTFERELILSSKWCDEKDLELQQHQYEQVMELKRAISLVCKSWRAMVLPYLFESISIHIDALIQRHKSDHLPHSLFNPHNPFRFVRSLRFKGNIWVENYNDPSPEIREHRIPRAGKLMIEFLEHCPQLIRVDLDLYPTIPSVLASALRVSGQTLRHIQLLGQEMDDFAKILSTEMQCVEELSL
jgi:hypothetical protein